MAIVAISLSPVGEGVSVGRYVSKAIDVLRVQERVRFEVGPMFTTLEGDLREVFDVIRKMMPKNRYLEILCRVSVYYFKYYSLKYVVFIIKCVCYMHVKVNSNLST